MEPNEKLEPLHILRGTMESFNKSHRVELIGSLVLFLIKLHCFCLKVGPDNKKFKDSEIHVMLQERFRRNELLNCSENDLRNFLDYVCSLIIEVKKVHQPTDIEETIDIEEKNTSISIEKPF